MMYLGVISINKVESNNEKIVQFFDSFPALALISQYSNILIVTVLNLIIPKVLELFIMIE